MDIWKAVLYLHIASGSLGLAAGALPIISTKGNRLHKNTGKAYLLFMFTGAISGSILGFRGGSELLFFIGIFSFYLSYTGYRALGIRRHLPALTFSPADYMVIPLCALLGLFMTTGAFIRYTDLSVQFNPVLLVFGGMLLTGSIRNIAQALSWRKQLPDKAFAKQLRVRLMRLHIGQSIGSYISAVTAFFVVNNIIPFLHYANWFLPSVLFVPIIIRFMRQYAPLHKKDALQGETF